MKLVPFDIKLRLIAKKCFCSNTKVCAIWRSFQTCNSWLISKWQSWLGGSLHGFIQCAKYTCSWICRACLQTFMLLSLPDWTTAILLHRAAPKDYPDISDGVEYGNAGSYTHSQGSAFYTSALWTILVASLFLSPTQGAGFNLQGLYQHQTVPSFPAYINHPIISCREGMLRVLSARDLHLVGPRRCAFSAVASALQNIISPEIRLKISPILFDFL